MKLTKIILLVSGLLIISCCVNNTNYLEKARKSYVAENYNDSINTLLPEARKGNSKAQYALGYIFYNKNEKQKGIYWMQQAARQGEYKARIALENISKAEQ